MESHKIPWFQSPPTSGFSIFFMGQELFLDLLEKGDALYSSRNRSRNRMLGAF